MEPENDDLKSNNFTGEALGPISEQEPEKSEADPNVTCPWDNRNYTVGSRICYNHTYFQCGSNGKWFNTNIGC
jgi:Protein of unknown function (DUF1496)